MNLVLRHCGFAAALLAVNLFVVLIMGTLAGVAYVLGYQPQLSQPVDYQRGLETKR